MFQNLLLQSIEYSLPIAAKRCQAEFGEGRHSAHNRPLTPPNPEIFDTATASPLTTRARVSRTQTFFPFGLIEDSYRTNFRSTLSKNDWLRLFSPERA